MKNLGKLLLTLLTFITFSGAQTKEISEEKEADSNYFKYLEQYLPEENISFYPSYNKDVKFDLEGKKVKISNSFNPQDYCSMIDPNSKKISELPDYFITGDSTMSIAENMFNSLKYYKFSGISYEYDPGQSPYEQLQNIDQFFSGPILYLSKNRDYIRYAEQTLDDRIGDCECLSILEVSCLLSREIPAALATTEDHAFVLIRLKDSELNFSESSKFVLDGRGHGWVPIDITGIGEKGRAGTFERALEKGMESYRFYYPYINVIIPEEYKKLFGY